MAKETSSKLARGVVFLTTANLIVKAAGLLFKIPLTAMIGEEGMGYYSGAYTLSPCRKIEKTRMCKPAPPFSGV